MGFFNRVNLFFAIRQIYLVRVKNIRLRVYLSYLLTLMAVIRCSFLGCIRTFKQPNHLTLHMNLTHNQAPNRAHSLTTLPTQNSLPNSPPWQENDLPPSQSPPPNSTEPGKTFHPYLTGKIIILISSLFLTQVSR